MAAKIGDFAKKTPGDGAPHHLGRAVVDPDDEC
jgi:hypothetical protein